jgi:hypothetical protein
MEIGFGMAETIQDKDWVLVFILFWLKFSISQEIQKLLKRHALSPIGWNEYFYKNLLA